MIRSLLAVLAGFCVVPVIALACDFLVLALMPGAYDAQGRSHDATALLLAIAYTAGAQVFGGWLTARLARRRPFLHASILAAAALALTIPVSLAHWHDVPAWYHFGTWLLTLPACWLGGSLVARRPAAAAAAAI